MDSEALMKLIMSDHNVIAILETIDSGAVAMDELRFMVPEPKRFDESILTMIELGLINPIATVGRP